MKAPLFHFFSYRMATRFHITRKLLALGWEKAEVAQKALFTDKNLSLDDECSKNLEYKHLLANLVSQYCPQIMPITYCINDSNASEVFAKMIYEHYLIQGKYEANVRNLKWILKPSTLNNGDEIKLFNNVEELKKHYASPQRMGGEHVIQQYIPHPALIEGRKYTFRMPVILTNYAGIFMYSHGYVNISAHLFNLEDGFKNKKVHITNYVLDGEFAHIEQRSTQTLENFDATFKQMAQIVVSVTKSLLKIAPKYLQLSDTKIVEFFGFDFMLDANGKVWLLEINQGPDTPTFEENALNPILWEPFWDEMIDQFVLSIALPASHIPKNAHHFIQLMKPPTNRFAFWKKWFA